MSGIGNTVWRPSKVEDQIYEYLNQPHFLCSSSEYRATAMEGIQNYLDEHFAGQWNIIEDPYPNMTGASVSVCWIEDGYLHHIVFNVRY